ncbi:MAG: glyceraldehyde-3-phosphate dehydrogenase, partial [Porticoccaceae bacterium]|nr:glyceraldehyde-3-phosphate dehydrogenase [Porticoccaceae bacterium]
MLVACVTNVHDNIKTSQTLEKELPVIDQKRPLPDDFFKDWKQREALAEGMIPIIGKLYRERNVSTYMYGNSMVNKSVTDLMKFHRRVRQVEQNELSEFDSSPMIEA